MRAHAHAQAQQNLVGCVASLLAGLLLTGDEEAGMVPVNEGGEYEPEQARRALLVWRKRGRQSTARRRRTRGSGDSGEHHGGAVRALASPRELRVTSSLLNAATHQK